MHHVDHILADVLGMVADSLQRPGHPGDVHDPTDGTRILHHEGDPLPIQCIVFLIHDVIGFDNLKGALHIQACKSIQGLVEHGLDMAG